MDKIVTANKDPNQGCILIVDDDTLILDILKKGLSLNGYQCEVAMTPTQALESIGKNACGVMVTDIRLPEMSGFELVAKVKKIRPDMTVIIMTGLIDEFSYDDAMDAGASDFIKKPFSLKELIARIEHARKHERLYDISLHDELTGLYNRRGFFTLSEHLLKTAMRQQKGFFMLYGDLDGLKKINDTLGHQKGDLALIKIANLLKETFRDSDLIARLGGDEFAVIPIDTTGGNIGTVLNRLEKAIENANEKNNRTYELSFSIGTAYFDPWSPCTIDELLSQSDKSMYEQKRSKRNS
jgi:two-component system cell cycle response regulator